MAVAAAVAVASTATLRLDSRKSNAALPDPLLIPKPTWLVRTESNVRRKRMRKPHPPCVVCQGSGRVDCQYCYGRGRTNQVHLEMLPKGEWPKWCRTCGGSGLSYCSRCLGTGEYRVQQMDCFNTWAEQFMWWTSITSSKILTDGWKPKIL